MMEKTLIEIANIDNVLILLKNFSFWMVFISLFFAALFVTLAFWYEKLRKFASFALLSYLLFILLFATITTIRNNYTIENKISVPEKSKLMETVDVLELQETSCEIF